MTPMLEKIARAILSCDAPCDDYFNRDVGTLLSVNPETATAIARAAMLAMREPDEATVDAGHEDSPYVDWHDVSDIFTAMIDATLAQPSTPTDVTPA